MLQALCGMLNSRVLPALISGPPNGPVELRVSATRHGDTGMNCSAVDGWGDVCACEVKGVNSIAAKRKRQPILVETCRGIDVVHNGRYSLRLRMMGEVVIMSFILFVFGAKYGW